MSFNIEFERTCLTHFVLYSAVKIETFCQILSIISTYNGLKVSILVSVCLSLEFSSVEEKIYEMK
jgi:hypothetical protein